MAFYAKQGLPKICIELRAGVKLFKKEAVTLCINRSLLVDTGFVDCFEPSKNTEKVGIIILQYRYTVKIEEEMAVFTHANPRKRKYVEFKIPKKLIYSVTDILTGKLLYAFTDK